jgi:hypothetical protein
LPINTVGVAGVAALPAECLRPGDLPGAGCVALADARLRAAGLRGTGLGAAALLVVGLRVRVARLDFAALMI